MGAKFTVLLALVSLVLGVALALFGLWRMGVLCDESDAAEITIADLIRDQVAWPASVALTKEITVSIVERGAASGFVVVQPGVIIRAKTIDKKGVLRCQWLDQELEVALEDTDLLNRLFGLELTPKVAPARPQARQTRVSAELRKL